MNIDTFLNKLFPGDKTLGVPKFTLCDERYILDGYLQSIPKNIINELSCVECDNRSIKEILKKLKSNNMEIQVLINGAISFYFSRVSVVKPLTGRSVPLTTSGMAKY